MAHWDTFASDYDRIFLEYGQYKASMDMMVDLLEGTAAHNVVDVGCGTGNLTARVLERLPGARVLGVDPSEGMKAVYTDRFQGEPGINFVTGNALRLPVDDGLFDAALSNLALHHILPDDRWRCARQLYRVLKPGGMLLYSDLFTDVEGSPEDPAWIRDVVEKHHASALHCLEDGAYEMMLIMMRTLPVTLRQEGEFITSEQVWMKELETTGFKDLRVVAVPPEDVGFRIVTGVRA